MMPAMRRAHDACALLGIAIDAFSAVMVSAVDRPARRETLEGDLIAPGVMQSAPPQIGRLHSSTESGRPSSASANIARRAHRSHGARAPCQSLSPANTGRGNTAAVIARARRLLPSTTGPR